MPSHVALLRGVNVGGRNKVAMADLRTVVESLGHGEVATYIQSGNELAAQLTRADPDAQDRGGTARNWATVTKLLAMLDA